MIGYLFILSFLVISKGYLTSISKYFNNIQTGVQAIALTVITTPSMLVSYDIHYITAFRLAPSVVLAFHTIVNCPQPSLIQNIMITSNTTTGTGTTHTRNAYLYTGFDYDSNIVIKVSYLAVNLQVNPNIQFLSMGTDLKIETYDFPSRNLLAPTTYIGCFPSRFYLLQSISTFVSKTYCIPKSKTALEYHFDTTANQIASPTDDYLRYRTMIIVIENIDTIEFTIGTLTSLTDKPPVNYKQESGYFFVGLTKFQTSNSCLNLFLNTNYQIGFSSNFYSIEYAYFYAFYKTVPKLQWVRSFTFRDAIKLQYSQHLQNYHTIDKSPTASSMLSNITTYSLATITTQLISPLDSSIIFYKNFMSNQVAQYAIASRFKIITSYRIVLYVISNLIDVVIKNIDDSVILDNFYTDNQKIIKQTVYDLTDKTVSFFYDKQTIGNTFLLSYISSDQATKASIQVTVPTITRIQTSAFNTLSSIKIQYIPNALSTVQSQYNWLTSTTQNHVFSQDVLGDIIYTFNYLSTVINNQLRIRYTANCFTKMRTDFSFYLTTIGQFQIIVNQLKCKATFLNIYNAVGTSLDQFSISNNGTQILIQSIQVLYGKVIVTMSYQQSSIGETFSLSYTPKVSKYSAIIHDIKIYQKYIIIQANIFTHSINLTVGIFDLTSPNIIIKSLPKWISVNNIRLDNDKIIIEGIYNESIDGWYYSLTVESDTNTIFFDAVGMQLIHSFPIVYCVEQFKTTKNKFEYVSLGAVYLYWAIFIISIFFCQKIYAVEMIFAIQLAFLTFIPIGAYCPPFTAMKILQYSFGWNGIPLKVQQTYFSYYYSSLGLQSNFLSNLNFMLIPLLIFPIIYFILNTASKYTDHYRKKPRLQIYGRTFLLDVPFTFVLINIPNTMVSFVINIQAFGSNNISSLTASIIILTIELVYTIIFCIFRNYFRQFKMQFCDRHQIFKIAINKSTLIRRLYPLVILMQMFSTSTILAIQEFFNYSLYIVLGIVIFNTILILIISPYKSTIDNVRLFIYRFFLLLICGVQIGFKVIKTQYSPITSIVYQYPWFILVILYLLAIGMFLPYLIFKMIAWVKSKSIIDLVLYQKQKKIYSKPFYPFQPIAPPILYPAMQFSRFKNRQERFEAQKVLQQIQKVNQKKQSEILWQQMQLGDAD